MTVPNEWWTILLSLLAMNLSEDGGSAILFI